MSGSKLGKVVALLTEHEHDLAAFFTNDYRGSQLPRYLAALSNCLSDEQRGLFDELNSMAENVDHINAIISVQQSYAGVAGVVEYTTVGELIEDALRLESASFARHNIRVVRDFAPEVRIGIQKQKVLQILINLIANAKHAMRKQPRAEGHILTVRAHVSDGEWLCMDMCDNGLGIPSEDLAKIFSYGYTTKPDGHGFGLHHSVLAAKELGGNLSVQSDGPGQGAVFSLHLPVEQPSTRFEAAS